MPRAARTIKSDNLTLSFTFTFGLICHGSNSSQACFGVCARARGFAAIFFVQCRLFFTKFFPRLNTRPLHYNNEGGGGRGRGGGPQGSRQILRNVRQPGKSGKILQLLGCAKCQLFIQSWALSAFFNFFNNNK